MDEVKFWNMIAVVAVIILWWIIKRSLDKFDKRFDDQDEKFIKQDEKLESIITKLDKQDKKILVHSIALRKLDPGFIVNYDD